MLVEERGKQGDSVSTLCGGKDHCDTRQLRAQRKKKEKG